MTDVHQKFIHQVKSVVNHSHLNIKIKKVGRYVLNVAKLKMGDSGARSNVKMGVSGNNIGHFGTDLVWIMGRGVSGTRYC